MDNDSLKVEPLKGIKKFHTRQSPNGHLPELPFRLVAVAGSGSGKSLTIQNMILKKSLYRDCWDYIILMGPTVRIDPQWQPVIDHMQKDLGRDTDSKTRPCILETFDNDALVRLLGDHEKLVKKLKSRKTNDSVELPAALFIFEDLADDPAAMRRSAILSMYVRMRHINCSCALLVQKYKLLSPIVRVNATVLLVWKLRNETESDQVCEDLSGRYGFKRTLEIYRLCTEEQYSFLMCDALRDTFFKRFELEVKVGGR